MAIVCLVATFHSLTVPSPEPDARVLLLGENATEVTKSVCPVSVAIVCLATTSHSVTVLSPAPADARVVPSGENATEVT